MVLERISPSSWSDWIPDYSLATEPELLVVLVQVCEPATTAATREKDVASDIVERSSPHWNTAE
ncbi:hypothetical protein M9458_049056, partial [Cirrhinus mrigala]